MQGALARKNATYKLPWVERIAVVFNLDKDKKVLHLEGSRACAGRKSILTSSSIKVTVQIESTCSPALSLGTARLQEYVTL